MEYNNCSWIDLINFTWMHICREDLLRNLYKQFQEE